MAFTLFDEDINLNRNSITLFKPHPITTVSRTALGLTLATPDEGILVYDLDEHQHYSWNGTIWVPIVGGGGSYTDEKAQDAVAAMLAAGTHTGITFAYNDTANSMSATVVETDPTVPSWVKNITITDKDDWNLAYNKKINNILISTDASTKTITLVQQDGSELTTTFNTTNVTIDEVFFIVGDSGSPVADAGTTFNLTDCSLIALDGKKIEIFRERARQIEGADFTYDPATGTIVATVPFINGERVVIHAYPIEVWRKCTLSNPGLFSAMLTNALDAFLINGTDNLVL